MTPGMDDGAIGMDTRARIVGDGRILSLLALFLR